MPLDQAIYSTAQGKIYGVRGQYVFRFNAVTAALEATFRFASAAWEVGSIVEIGTNLYASVQRVPVVAQSGLAATVATNDIYKIPLPGMNTSALLGLNGKLNFVAGNFGLRSFSHLVTDGTFLYGTMQDASFFRCNPTNAFATFNLGFTTPYQFSDGDLTIFNHTYNGNPTVIVASTSSFPDVSIEVWRTDSTQETPSPVNVGAAPGCDGLCYDSIHDKLYATTGSQTLVLLNVNEAFAGPFLTSFTYSLLNTGRINANPFRCKFCSLVGNPYFGKVLIPAWNDDTVLVWNTATNNPTDMVIKTGFTSPFDIVFTPSKAFAVQNSPVGLKEVV